MYLIVHCCFIIYHEQKSSTILIRKEFNIAFLTNILLEFGWILSIKTWQGIVHSMYIRTVRFPRNWFENSDQKIQKLVDIKRKDVFWHILAARLAFVVIFQVWFFFIYLPQAKVICYADQKRMSEGFSNRHFNRNHKSFCILRATFKSFAY